MECSLFLYRLEFEVFQDRGSCLRRNDGLFQTMHPLSCDGGQGQRNPIEIMVERGYAEWQGVGVSGLWSMRSRGSCLRRNDGLFQTMHPLSCDGGQGQRNPIEIMVEVGYAGWQRVSVMDNRALTLMLC